MLHIALYQPEIPPNTGNIIRLCANTGAQLHLIHPLGFQLENKQMRRAGLDYAEWANIKHYPSFQAFQAEHVKRRIFTCSTKGTTLYSTPSYKDEDLFLFGQETKGLPTEILALYPLITLPMHTNSRSLNLSNVAAIVIYEAWKQLNFNLT